MDWLFYSRLQGRNGHWAGRELLSIACEQIGIGKMPQIEMEPQGKPYFADSSVSFSISHTDSHVFCLISHEPVGVDAENLERRVNLRLAEKILSAEEKKQYDRAEDKNKALLSFWVMKEAYLKYLGTGLRGYPNDTAFSLNDSGLMEIDGCVVAAFGKDGLFCCSTPILI